METAPRSGRQPTRVAPDRAIGLDVGAARIGVAVTESGLLSRPHGTIRRSGRAASEVATLAESFGATVIVIGLPLRMRGGGEGNQAAQIRLFASELASRTTIPIAFYDERLTTVMATRSLQASGTRGSKLKAQVDATAAAIILQSWLDQQRLAAERERAAQGEPPSR